MKTIEIKGTARVAGGKKAAKQLRKQGMIPCNIYGELKDEQGLPKAVAFAVSEGELRKLIYTPEIYTVKLDVDGQQCLAILKEAQFHPVKDHVLHVDFYQITDEKPIVMEVPIKLNGLAAGVKAGGKLAASVRKLKVKAVHTAIPERLDIDVTNLELGKTIKVGELSFEGLELVTSPSVVVCQVKMTRNARSAASAAEEAEA
ncbi:MAG: 50S ribosomal protein L25/general stress protein Ctc [Bacteroidaceae bacterium]|nr:50S ribosomal protein L25/general stress protein Ctc [Bacteroidaceae bacterium]